MAFVGTDTGTLAALDTRTGARLWTHAAPTRTGCGPSVVNGRVLWGYGFTLFAGAGDGGVISFGSADSWNVARSAVDRRAFMDCRRPLG